MACFVFAGAFFAVVDEHPHIGSSVGVTPSLSACPVLWAFFSF